MCQKFIAVEPYNFSNGAVGYRPGGPFDCLGPYAKVNNCPIDDTNLRLTCYATSYPDSYFSVPACTRRRGKYIKGFFTVGYNGEGIKFVADGKYKHLLK